MATWYYVENNQQTGPVDEAEFARRVSQGQIQTATLVWNETMANWQSYGQMRAASVQRQAEALATGGASTGAEQRLAPLRAAPGNEAAPPVAITCTGCGRSFPADEVIPINGQWICARCKPLALQSLREGAASPTALRYAGFWTRVVAKLIDGVSLLLVNLVVGSFIQGGFTALGAAVGGSAATMMSIGGFGVTLLVQLLIGLCYTVFFLGRFAATPGKMACGLLVVRADGSALTYARAGGRHFADMLSGLTLCIGYLIAAFDAEKRALHDHLCDTRVIYR